MTHTPEDQLALYLDGALEQADAVVVSAHIEECPECQSSLEELRNAVGWLKETASEPSGGELLELRRTVLGAVQRGERNRGGALIAAGVAAAALFAAAGLKLILPPKGSAPVNGPQQNVIAVLKPDHDSKARGPVAASHPVQSIPTLPRRRKVRQSTSPALLTLKAQRDGPPVIRVKTTDPNVVILWVMNEGPEQEKRNE
jgi:Putative zinc-finger